MEMVVEGERHGEEGRSPPPPTPTASAYHDKQDESKSPANYSQSLSERKMKDICLRCQKQGHWARDCPTRTPTKASSSQPFPPEDIHHLPLLRCHCGVACTIGVSRSEANPGRRYYTRNCSCDNVKATQGKKFFQWCDNVKALMCKCGAGACTINIQRDDNGKDIKYYTCRIRKGHGSCGFLQFDSPNSQTVPRSMEKDKQPSVLSAKHGVPPNILTHENEYPFPSFSDRNIVVPEQERCNLVMGIRQHVSLLMSPSDIHFRQIEFWNQISLAGNSANECKVPHIFGLHVHGWMGIFPLFDPLLASEYVNISDRGSSSIVPHTSSDAKVDEVSQNALGNDIQLLGVPLGTSSPKRSFTAVQEDVTNPILKEIEKKLQIHLPTLLESMEPPDHDTMLKAANGTFDALAYLSIECGPFAEHMMEFIQRKSRVAQMDSTVQDNSNLQELTIHKNIEKCLDDVSGIHAEALATLTASSNYLQSAHKEACHLKDMLCQIENQLHRCVTETSKLETLLLDIAKDVGQSKRSMQTAYRELTKALKLQKD
ncbi:uncharacterized protein LOC111305596 isoform X2 [Durio zibethinus]|uniref:Uncharacterized protein LOC111305596 isoform X2 n=1 Tax=Durio zibethinus TaxID=66656 RepID=A0A6P6A1Z6_DURZI|nr:uncharacterized protein LOC111305596 isoform X2 [Durio zibethinus]